MRRVVVVGWLAVVAVGCAGAEEVPQGGEVGSLADDLALLDDFEGPALDGRFRWGVYRPGSTRVDAGALVLDSRVAHADHPTTGSSRQQVRVQGGERVDSVSATIRVDDYEALQNRVQGFVGLHYQPEEFHGTLEQQIGIRAMVGAWRSSAMRAEIHTYHCTNADCSEFSEVPVEVRDYPSWSQIDVSVPHTLGVRYDDAAQRFVIAFDGGEAWVDVSAIEGFDPDDQFAASITSDAFNSTGPGGESRLTLAVDDVYVDGSLYDDFSAGQLAPAKWGGWRENRSIVDGELHLGAGGDDAGWGTALPLLGAAGVRELAASVRVDAVDWQGEGPGPSARLGGYWFDDGSAGEEPEGREGLIAAWVGIGSDHEVEWTVDRCLSAACDEVETLGTGGLGEAAPGEAEQLYIAFNGTHFTFQQGGAEPVSFDAVRAGAVPVGGGSGEFRGLSAGLPAGGEGEGLIDAVFDDVRTNATGRLAVAEHAWGTADTPEGLTERVVIGPEGADGSPWVLQAVEGVDPSGDCIAASCRTLRVEIPVGQGGGVLLGEPVEARAIEWRDDDLDQWESLTGHLVFERWDGPGGLAEGTLVLEGAVGGTGHFQAPIVASVVRPADAGTEEQPAWSDEGCADWPVCNFSVDAGRTTRLAFGVDSGPERAVHIADTEGRLTVLGPDGETLCTESVSSGSEAICRVTTPGETLYVEFEGLGSGGERVDLGIGPDFTDLAADVTHDLSVPVADDAWYRVRGEGSHVVHVLADDPASASLEVYQGDDSQVIGNGYCCGRGNGEEHFVPPTPDGWVWVQVSVHEDQSWVTDGGFQEPEHDFALTVRSTPDGDAPEEAVARAETDAYHPFNYLIDPGQDLYVAFQPHVSGPHLQWAGTRDWDEVQGPIDLALFTDPGDPAGSAVRTTEGDLCEARLIGEPDQPGAWITACYTLLDADTTYYTRLTSRAEVPGVQGQIWTEFSAWDGTIVEPGTEVSGALAPGGEEDRFTSWLEPGVGYVYEATSSHPQGEGVGLHLNAFDAEEPWTECSFCWRDLGGMGTWSGRTFGLTLPASEAPPFVGWGVSNWNGDGTGEVQYTARLVPGGTGESLDSPVPLAPLKEAHQDGWLDDGDAHYYALDPADSGSSVVLRIAEVDTGSRRWTGGWGLYLDGQTQEVWCEATEEGIREGESSVAECTVTLARDASYVLEIVSSGEDGRFRYSFEGH